jgi:hypothetical protein
VGDWGLIFLAGVVGSLHCLGMCSPLVLTYALNLPGGDQGAPSGFAVITPHLRYHAGRITVYAALGLLSALLGTALGQVARFTGIQGGALLAGGAFMLAYGLGMLGMRLFPSRLSLEASPRVWGWFRKRIDGLLGTGRAWAQVRLGMLNGLVPCGLVYGMLGRAAAAAPLEGALVMLVFGAGTAPTMITLGTLSRQVSRRWRQRGDRLAAVLVIVLGLLLLMRGAARNGWVPHLKALGIMFW